MTQSTEKVRPDIVVTFPPDFDGELHIQVDSDTTYHEFRFRVSKTISLGDMLNTLTGLTKSIYRWYRSQK